MPFIPGLIRACWDLDRKPSYFLGLSYFIRCRSLRSRLFIKRVLLFDARLYQDRYRNEK